MLRGYSLSAEKVVTDLIYYRYKFYTIDISAFKNNLIYYMKRKTLTLLGDSYEYFDSKA